MGEKDEVLQRNTITRSLRSERAAVRTMVSTKVPHISWRLADGAQDIGGGGLLFPRLIALACKQRDVLPEVRQSGTLSSTAL